MAIRRISTKGNEVRWEVRLYLDGRGTKRIKRVFSKRSDADEFLAEYASRKRSLDTAHIKTQQFEATTFSKEAEFWLERRGLVFSPGHLRRVTWVLKKILPRFGYLNPNELHPQRLSLFQSEELRSGLSAASVNRKTEVITAILTFSTKQKRIPFNPALGFEKLPEHREDMQFWERHEAEGFLSFINRKYPTDSTERWRYVVYLLALNTGLRAGEIWGLKPCDISTDKQVLYIKRQWDLVSRDFRLPKGKKCRYVPCNAVLYEELAGLIQKGGISEDQTIFRSRVGTPVSHDNFDDDFRSDLSESGIKPIRFHDLRHTATTLMIADGLDVKTVKEICGHKNISTTMNYIHLLGESIKNVSKTFAVKPVTHSNLKLVVDR